MTAVAGPTQFRFLAVAEAANDLHAAEWFIREVIANGDLRAVKVGTRLVRVRREDLDELIHPLQANGPSL